MNGQPPAVMNIPSRNGCRQEAGCARSVRVKTGEQQQLSTVIVTGQQPRLSGEGASPLHCSRNYNPQHIPPDSPDRQIFFMNT